MRYAPPIYFSPVRPQNYFTGKAEKFPIKQLFPALYIREVEMT
jgi:hypothetical protein